VDELADASSQFCHFSDTIVRSFRPKKESFIGARSHRSTIIYDELTFLCLVFDTAFSPCFCSALTQIFP
jgi:hypothetical protein